MSRIEAEETLPGDPLLERLYRTSGEEREREIADLIVTIASPFARRAVRRYTKGDSVSQEDAEDIIATVSLRLVAKLRSIETMPHEPIEQFGDYVSQLTFNALSDHFRKRFPQRSRLKNRLRYTLTHDLRLALWTADEMLLCGLAKWRGKPAVEVPPMFSERVLHSRRDRPVQALLELFASCGGPLPFETLVDLLAGPWHFVDAPPALTVVSEPAERTHAAVEGRELLAALWREIEQLRPMQRRALLLNLRDAETAHVLSLLVFTGVASMDAIARAVEMTRAELDAIWNDLPLDDLRIGAMLGVTRQQVINLRKSARERLGRRLSYERKP